MRIEVGMHNAGSKEITENSPDTGPGVGGNFGTADGIGECARSGKRLCDEIGAIQKTRSRNSRGDRRGHGKTSSMQSMQKPPFAEGSRTLESEPHIDVTQDFRHEPAAPIVAQNPVTISLANKDHSAPPSRARDDQSPVFPIFRRKSAFVRFTCSRRVV